MDVFAISSKTNTLCIEVSFACIFIYNKNKLFNLILTPYVFIYVAIYLHVMFACMFVYNKNDLFNIILLAYVFMYVAIYLHVYVNFIFLLSYEFNYQICSS